jgi:hypothetical protein
MAPLLLLLTVAAPTPEERAVAYLAREVPRWSPANKCFSCHNNGVAAAALAAARLKVPPPPRALDDTLAWLGKPDAWDRSDDRDARTGDRTLTRLHFAAALADAAEAGLVADRAPLRRAAELVAAQQRPDGGWRDEAGAEIGSSITLGPALTTALARQTLLRADAARHRAAVERADAWLRRFEAKTVLDAAAVLLGLGDAADEAAERQRRRCLEVLRKGVSQDEGGWGPYTSSAPEVFDTAVVVLALAAQRPTDEARGLLQGGRKYLLATQGEDGGWPATTRPPGRESYSQRVATSAWAARALLATK